MVPLMDEGEWIVFAFHKDDERQVRRVNSLKRHSELMVTQMGSSAKSVGEKWAYGGFVLARWIF